MRQGVTIEQKLDVKNTFLKLVIDQVVGGAANTVVFLVLITAVRGGSVIDCTDVVRVVRPYTSSFLCDMDASRQ